MDKKTRDVFLRILQTHGNPTVTVIMKALYLIDLTAYRRLRRQITPIKYVRYNYGPFNSDVYVYLEELEAENLITPETSYFGGNEVVTYKPKVDAVTSSVLDAEEQAVVEEVLDSISGLGASVITDITYETAPMKKIGAVRGSRENIGVELDLSAE